MSFGKSIELFLVNGTADSIITAELSNWNGKAIKIPRIEVQKCKRPDISDPGVYFLFCKEDDGDDAVYIGEAENINTGRDLNKALIRYLEYRLVEIARSSKRYKVLTKNTYKNTVMKESQISAMEEFIENIKILINALGYKVLEPVAIKPAPESAPEVSEEYTLSTGSAHATGVVTSEGFVVYKGAVINEKVSVKSVGSGAVKLRAKHISEGRVVDNTTTEDILFSSSSAAAVFVLGYSVSGPATWKAKDGRTLKEIEESSTDNGGT